MPFATLVLYAGIQGISNDFYKTATVDGAGSIGKNHPYYDSYVAVFRFCCFLDEKYDGNMNIRLCLDYYERWPRRNDRTSLYLYLQKGMIGFNIGMGRASTSIIFLLSFLVRVWFIGTALKKKVKGMVAPKAKKIVNRTVIYIIGHHCVLALSFLSLARLFRVH